MADQQYPDPDATGAGEGAGLYLQNGVRASSQDVTDPTLQAISNYNGEADHHQGMAALQQHNNSAAAAAAAAAAGLMDPPSMLPPQLHSPQRVAQSAMSLDGSPYDHRGNQRKRTKTTRACDECRRKKIRCDSEDGGPEACSSCKRTGAPCRFSRTPQKRGPSKGYIKELADRVTSLEALRQRVEAGQDITRDYPIHPATPDLSELARHMSESRKRTFSMSDEQNASQSPTQPYSTHMENHDIGEDEFDRDTLGGTLNPTEYQQSIFDTYYATIHRTLPLLPPHRNTLLSLLSDCQAVVRDALIQSLDCAVRHFVPPGTIQPQPDLVKKTVQLLGSAASVLTIEDDARRASNLLMLASSHVLMAIEAGQQGPSKQARHYVNHYIANAGSIVLQDADLFQSQGKEEAFWRVFGTLYMIERFNLITQSQEKTISSRYDQILRKYRSIEPEAYCLARVAECLGNIRENYQSNFIRQQNGNPSERVEAEQIQGPLFKSMTVSKLELAMDGAGVSPNLALQLACQHGKLAIALISDNSTAEDILTEASLLATLLLQQAATKTTTPLNYHFAALATAALLDLLNNDKTRDDATRLIEKLDDALQAGNLVPPSSSSTSTSIPTDNPSSPSPAPSTSSDAKRGWDAALAAALRKARPSADGLAQLADAAAERDNNNNHNNTTTSTSTKPAAAADDEDPSTTANATTAGTATDASDVSAMATAAAISASQAHMALQLHNTTGAVDGGQWEPAAIIRDGVAAAFAS